MPNSDLTKKDMELLLDKEAGLLRSFNKIKTILEKYMDMEKEYYSLVAIWIIGTYLHKQFSTYPYLYFNAMKGSGKTRMLKIIANLSKNGKVVGSMSEAVLFRTAKTRTLCIDELEGINAKGNENLKLLLNSAYKKGLSVERMKRNKEGAQEVEEFEVYCPVAMANIWGMENVLSDRCLSVILEKSSKNEIVKLIETFETDMDFQKARGSLLNLTEKIKDDCNIFGHIFDSWNKFQILGKTDDIDNIDDTYAFTKLYKSIDSTNLSGRDLELFFPLFIISDMVDEKILNEILETAQKIVKIRKESDREENKDIRLIEFIAQSNYEGYVDISNVAKEFSEFYDEDIKYNSSRSVSRALNRLKLILDKRNTGKNRQVKLDVLKAQEKLLLFKDPSQDENVVSNVSIVSNVSDVNIVNNNEEDPIYTNNKKSVEVIKI